LHVLRAELLSELGGGNPAAGCDDHSL
jgi:hypothetical protein